MLTAAALALVAAALAVLLLAPRVWSLLGPADLGEVSFETLQRRASPNDALAAPAGLGPASVDIVPPVLAVDADTLKSAFEQAVASERRLQRVAEDARSRTQRYVQRSALLGFPDTIVVRFIELPDKRSTLAIYSRSQVGYSDLGVNKARIVRWLARLEAVAPVAR